MKLIFKYSPFKNMDELNRQFEKIRESGTLVVVYNLLLNERHEPNLQWNSDKTDIIVKDQPDLSEPGDEDLQTRMFRITQAERQSLRKYLAILYKIPRMEIFISGLKVETVILDRTLYMRREYEVVKNADMTGIGREIEETMNDMRSRTFLFLY
jgi:hypothetical protein